VSKLILKLSSEDYDVGSVVEELERILMQSYAMGEDQLEGQLWRTQMKKDLLQPLSVVLADPTVLNDEDIDAVTSFIARVGLVELNSALLPLLSRDDEEIITSVAIVLGQLGQVESGKIVREKFSEKEKLRFKQEQEVFRIGT